MLLVYNKTGAAVTLAAGNPVRAIPLSSAPPARGPGVNCTSELRGLSGANYTALQAQAASLDFEWTGDPEYATGALVVSGPAPGTHATTHAAAATDPITVTYGNLDNEVYGVAQTLTGAGAIDLVHRSTRLACTGVGDACVLADSTKTGQRKTIIQGSNTTPGTNTSVVTCTGGNWTLAAIGDWVEIEWNGAAWSLRGTNILLYAAHLAFAGQAIGDLPVADSATSMARLAAGGAGTVLTSGGAGVAPSWGAAVTGVNKKTLTLAAGVRAKLKPNTDLGTTVIDSLLRLDVTGLGGNAVTLTLVADSGAKAGSIGVVGNAITVHFQDGVSQVSDFEALFPAVCTFGSVAVVTPGTAATVLNAPADVFGPSSFLNGTNGSFTAAAVSQVINLDTALPANARILGAEIRVSTPVSGTGSANATVDIGGTDPDCIVDGESIHTGCTTEKHGIFGINPNGMLSAQQLTATVASNVNMNLLSAGSVVIDVFYLPLA